MVLVEGVYVRVGLARYTHPARGSDDTRPGVIRLWLTMGTSPRHISKSS